MSRRPERDLISYSNQSPSSATSNAFLPEARSGMASVLKDRWEERQYREQRVKNSPTLAQLQSRSERQSERKAGFVYAAQKELQKKHHDAKSKVHGVSGIGGGVSLWPAMDDMRLSRGEVNLLMVVCGVLIVATMSVFLACHGECALSLWVCECTCTSCVSVCTCLSEFCRC